MTHPRRLRHHPEWWRRRKGHCPLIHGDDQHHEHWLCARARTLFTVQISQSYPELKQVTKALRMPPRRFPQPVLAEYLGNFAPDEEVR